MWDRRRSRTHIIRLTYIFFCNVYLYMLGRKWLQLVINSWSFSLSLLFLIFRKDNLNKNQKSSLLVSFFNSDGFASTREIFFRSPHTTTRSYDGHSNIKLNDFFESAIYISRLFLLGLCVLNFTKRRRRKWEKIMKTDHNEDRAHKKEKSLKCFSHRIRVKFEWQLFHLIALKENQFWVFSL